MKLNYLLNFRIQKIHVASVHWNASCEDRFNSHVFAQHPGILRQNRWKRFVFNVKSLDETQPLLKFFNSQVYPLYPATVIKRRTWTTSNSKTISQPTTTAAPFKWLVTITPFSRTPSRPPTTATPIKCIKCTIQQHLTMPSHCTNWASRNSRTIRMHSICKSTRTTNEPKGYKAKKMISKCSMTFPHHRYSSPTTIRSTVRCCHGWTPFFIRFI